jgi:hypothetical protein
LQWASSFLNRQRKGRENISLASMNGGEEGSWQKRRRLQIEEMRT